MSAPRVPGGNPSDPWPIVNEALDLLAHQQVYAWDPDTTEGLTLGYLGGMWGGFTVNDGTLTLTDDDVNYVVVARATGVISASTATTNWNNLDDYARVWELETADGEIITPFAEGDHRGGPGGVHGQGPNNGGSAGPAPLITEGTSSRDVTTADAGSYIRFTGTGAKTCVFDVAESFASPQEYHVANRAASGNLTLSGTGVTLNAPKGGTLVLEPGDTVTVKFVDTDEADVFGSTEPV